MLETVRAFARQRPADSAKESAVRDRHLAYLLDLARGGGKDR